MSFEREPQDGIPGSYFSASPEEKMKARLQEAVGIIAVQNADVISPGFEPDWLKQASRKAELDRIVAWGTASLRSLPRRRFRGMRLSEKRKYIRTSSAKIREEMILAADRVLKTAQTELTEIGASA